MTGDLFFMAIFLNGGKDSVEIIHSSQFIVHKKSITSLERVQKYDGSVVASKN